MTQTDLRIEFAGAESVPYDTVVDNIPKTPHGVHGNIYPNRYIAWLEEQLLICRNHKLDYNKLQEEFTQLEVDYEELENETRI